MMKMLCERCKKNNANIKIVKNYNGNIEELYLCSECAEKEDINFNKGIYKNSLFDDMFNVFTPRVSSELKCQTCNMTYSEFKKKGKFGCADCYSAFEKYLDPVFKNIHGATCHEGKIPERSSAPLKLKKEIARLKEELKKAVAEENFEEAARLRDEIRGKENM